MEFMRKAIGSPGNFLQPLNLGEALKRAYRPGPATVLQALTMSCSNDFINLERMETIGDSFLKFVVTVHLYLRYPAAHEGKLSHLRSRIVSISLFFRGHCFTLYIQLASQSQIERIMHTSWIPLLVHHPLVLFQVKSSDIVEEPTCQPEAKRSSVQSVNRKVQIEFLKIL
ncbi:unnamed protein product [Trichobilharzia regenti]|nr:unnamed protein product [Trichobilharzia regenti]